MISFLGKRILFRGNYNFWCKSDHFWGLNSDLLCYFHPKIASVKLVKTPPKAREWSWAPCPPPRTENIHRNMTFFINGLPKLDGKWLDPTSIQSDLSVLDPQTRQPSQQLLRAKFWLLCQYSQNWFQYVKWDALPVDPTTIRPVSKPHQTIISAIPGGVIFGQN